MSGQAAKPIIFLAFANDRAGGLGYLRNLPDEARRLREWIEKAAGAGLCELILRQNATTGEVLDVFQDGHDRSRIAVFHYGGHADGYRLLLETAEGQHALADAGGLAALLGQQSGLELVFLNGCSTQQQAQGLLDAGVSTVIATSQAIDDAVATDFAARFYQGLASGASLQTAFNEAVAASITTHGSETRHLYYAGDQTQATADRWPWTLYQRPGAELVMQWNLPQAANDPLFGLPHLPIFDLPDSPYRHLDWFRREHAAIFFGRGHAIRDLYQRVTAPEAPPIILFYGQSGVGKSSLLAAGLLPRMENSHRIYYTRRDQSHGLLGTVRTALAADDAGAAVGDDLAQVWRNTEARSGKPLVVILDQAEELYTRPHPALGDEMGIFLAALQPLFADPAQRPQGRLILSFRKEWLAEIEKHLAEAKLPRAKVFLERLDQLGIVDAVTGPARIPRLQQHYGLTIENGLPDQIADDLLEDRGAAVAPTLQVLLTKLWERAKAGNHDYPCFDRDLYARLRKEGILLKDFLDQQLVSLRQDHAKVVNSGLALDLLAFHTTPLGTAEQRTLADLHEIYRHQVETLPTVMRKFQDLYLLVDPAQNQPDAAPASRLAHDTLAPLVRAEFEASDLPGQRARRILENRAVEWEDEEDITKSTPLDRQDLVIVEQGELGMRSWTEAEQRLVTASRQREAKRRRNLRFWQVIGIGAIALIIATAWVAWIQRGLALQRESEANIAKQEALTREAEAETAKDEADQQAREAKVAELVAETQNLLQVGDIDSSPSLPLMLAQRAVLTTLVADEFVSAAAEARLRDAINAASPWIMSIPRQRHSGPVMSLDISPDGQTLLSASSDLSARLWSLRSGQEVQRLIGHDGPVWSARFSPDGKQIVTASVDGTVRLWEAASAQELFQLSGHIGTVWSAIYSAEGRHIFSAGEDHSVRMWEAETGHAVRQFVGHQGRVLAVAAHPDGKTLASAGADGTIRLWDIATGVGKSSLNSHNAVVTTLRFLSQGKRLISGDGDGVLRVWDIASGAEVSSWQPQQAWIGGLAVNKDESLVAIASHDGAISVWDVLAGKAVTSPMHGHGSAVNAVVFTPDDQQLISGSDDQSIRRWEIATGNPVRFLPGHYAPVVRVLYASNGQFIVSADSDGAILLHDPFTGHPIATLPDPKPVLSLALSADNKTLISGEADQTIRVWNIISRTAVAQSQAHAGAVLAVKFSPDDSLVATAGDDGLVCLWHVLPLEKITCLEHPDRVRAVAFSADSQRLITGCDDGKLRLWDMVTFQNVATTAAQAGWFTALALSPDGRQLATAIEANLQLWEMPLTAQPRQTLSGHTGPINAIAYAPDGQRLASASRDKSIRLWNLTMGQQQVRLDGHEDSTQFAVLYGADGVTGLSFSPDGKTLVTGGADNTVRFWDIRPDRPDGRLDGVHGGQLASATISSSGQYAVTAGYEDGLVVIWSLATEQPIVSLNVDQVQATFAVLSQDEKMVAAGFNDGAVRVWSVPGGQLLQELPHAQRPWRLAFHPNGDRLAVASWDGTTYVWDIASGQTLLQLSANGERLWSVQFSHDGQQIITAGEDRQVHVWDAEQGAKLQSIAMENSTAVKIALFSPDDQLIVTGVDAEPFGSNATDSNSAPLAADFALRLFDAQTGQQIRQFVGHTAPITWADFDSTGRTLATASMDQTIRLWDVNSGVEARRIQLPDSITTVFFLPDDQTVISAGNDGVARLWPDLNALLRQAAALNQREPALFWRTEQSRYTIDASFPQQ